MSDKLAVSMTRCFLCGGEKDIVMNTRLTQKCADNVKEMNGKVIDYEPCNKCKEYMKQGIILISVRDNDQEYRTGGWVVVKDEFVKSFLTPEMWEQVNKKRAAFIPDSIWDKLGLPRGEV